MKTGFDIDGVAATQNITEIILAKTNPFLEKLYYDTRKPLLPLRLFLAENDVGYIISARNPSLREVTRRWCKKYYPEFILLHAEKESWTKTQEVPGWFKEVAKAKAKVINEVGLDVYFEDLHEVVRWLRVMCPKTKIIHYGGRLNW